jgi:hypothetical protein
MATYKGIQGFTIQNLSADPSNPIEGQVWYNSTSNVWKVEEATAVGAWASGGGLPTATDNNAGAGYQTTGLTFGGDNPGGADTTASYSYDGSAWSPTSSLNTGRRYLMGGGTQTAALAVGGISTAQTGATELYDGSTWTSNPTGLTRGSSTYDAGQAGTQTAALVFGGEPATTATESWNGSIWTAVNSMNTARWSLAGAGTQTAGLAFGGYTGTANTGATEEYDGTSWATSPGSLNTARNGIDGSINGTQTATLAFGGNVPPNSNATELYDGISWTTSPASLSTSRVRAAGAGTASSALATGGANPGGRVSATEEWTGAGAAVTKTITVS